MALNVNYYPVPPAGRVVVVSDTTLTVATQILTVAVPAAVAASGYFRLGFKHVATQSTTSFLLINGATTNIDMYGVQQTNGSTGAGAMVTLNNPDMYIQPYDAGTVSGQVEVYGVVGDYRIIRASYSEIPASGTPVYHVVTWQGAWKDKTNAITSIGFNSTAAGDINVGTHVTLSYNQGGPSI